MFLKSKIVVLLTLLSSAVFAGEPGLNAFVYNDFFRHGFFCQGLLCTLIAPSVPEFTFVTNANEDALQGFGVSAKPEELSKSGVTFEGTVILRSEVFSSPSTSFEPSTPDAVFATSVGE